MTDGFVGCRLCSDKVGAVAVTKWQKTRAVCGSINGDANQDGRYVDNTLGSFKKFVNDLNPPPVWFAERANIGPMFEFGASDMVRSGSASSSSDVTSK